MLKQQKILQIKFTILEVTDEKHHVTRPSCGVKRQLLDKAQNYTSLAHISSWEETLQNVERLGKKETRVLSSFGYHYFKGFWDIKNAEVYNFILDLFALRS